VKKTKSLISKWNKLSLWKKSVIVGVLLGLIQLLTIFYEFHYTIVMVMVLVSFIVQPFSKFIYFNIFPLDLIMLVLLVIFQWIMLSSIYFYFSKYFKANQKIILIISITVLSFVLFALTSIALGGSNLSKEYYIAQNIEHQFEPHTTLELNLSTGIVVNGNIVYVTKDYYGFNNPRTHVLRNGNSITTIIIPYKCYRNCLLGVAHMRGVIKFKLENEIYLIDGKEVVIK